MTGNGANVFGEYLTRVVFCDDGLEPVRKPFMPAEIMAAHPLPVGIGKGQNRISRSKIIFVRGRMDGVPLHRIFCDKKVLLLSHGVRILRFIAELLWRNCAAN